MKISILCVPAMAAMIGLSACNQSSLHHANVSDHWNVKLLPESKALGFQVNQQGAPVRAAVAVDVKELERRNAPSSVQSAVIDQARGNLDKAVRTLSQKLGYSVSAEQAIVSDALDIISLPDNKMQGVAPDQRVVWRCLVADHYRFTAKPAAQRHAAPEAAKGLYAKAFGLSADKISYELADDKKSVTFNVNQPNVCMAYQALSLKQHSALSNSALDLADEQQCASFIPGTRQCKRPDAAKDPYYLTSAKPYSEKITLDDIVTGDASPSYRLKRIPHQGNVHLTLCKADAASDKQDCSTVINKNKDTAGWNARFTLDRIPDEKGDGLVKVVQLNLDGYVAKDGNIALKQAYMTTPTYRYQLN